MIKHFICSAIVAISTVALVHFVRASNGKPSNIAITKHNLSVSGPGSIVALEETEICIFCHTPHNAQAETALWNRQQSTGPFITYWSSSLDAYTQSNAPEPDGSSKLCLSCHDGTLALGALLSREQDILMAGTQGGRMPSSASGYVGQDLTGGHPISFIVTDNLISTNNAKDSQLASLSEMRSDPDVSFDKNGKIQCTTCHNPHDDSNYGASGIHFYVKPSFSDACVVCHRN